MREDLCFELSFGGCMTKQAMFELFKQDIDKCQSSMELLGNLASNQFSFTQLFELIQTTSNSQNQALLITYFINNLKNEEDTYNKLVRLLAWTHPHHPINAAHHLEDCLVFAIYCYLNGSTKKAEHIAYINLLTKALLNKNYPLTLPTLHGLLLCCESLDELVHEDLMNLLFCQRRQVNSTPFVQVLQLIGHRGGSANYQQVITLGEKALEVLDPKLNQYLIETINTALTEAHLELELSQDTGFWTQLFGHFRRCFTYGWSGFLNPNPPTYVRVAENNLQDAPQQQSPYPNPLINFYSVAHFDSLVETTWWYFKTQQKDDYSELTNHQELEDSLKIMEMLMVNDFYKDINEIVHNDSIEVMDLTVVIDKSQEESMDETLFEKEPSFEADLPRMDSLSVIDDDDDSPFYGFNVPKVIAEPAKVSIPKEKDFLDEAKDMIESASTYAEGMVEEMKIMEDINTVKEYVSSASTYAGQLWSGLSGWTTNSFFALSNPLSCTSKSVEDKTKEKVF